VAAPAATTEPARQRRVLPLAVRLVLIYALVVAAALLIVAALAVQLTRSHLQSELDRRLAAVATSFRDGPARQVADSDELALEARVWLASQPQPPDQIVMVRTADSELLATSSDLDLRTVEGSVGLLEGDRPGWATLASTGTGPDVRTLSVPLSLGDEPAGTLVAAVSTESVDRGVEDLLRQVMWAAAAGLVLALLLGFLAVRRTLRPLRIMAADIDDIQDSGDPSQRVRVSGPPDEVGRLGLALNRTLARLEDVVDSQRQFVADASHELRTPLTVARGQLELLDAALADPDTRRSLGLALDELDRMARMVGDLLLLARLDEGLALEPGPVEVELVVGEALLRVGGPGERTTAEILSDIPPGLSVSADSEALLQVLTNLLTNAVRHGGDRIAVVARADGRRVTIDVSDDGSGIPQSELERLFDRFYRGAVTRGRTPGAGLGLAIARTLVERMGGTVTVRSATGEGTTFTVDLPAAAPGA
jgi:signal transduction histidine kinase